MGGWQPGDEIVVRVEGSVAALSKQGVLDGADLEGPSATGASRPAERSALVRKGGSVGGRGLHFLEHGYTNANCPRES